MAVTKKALEISTRIATKAGKLGLTILDNGLNSEAVKEVTTVFKLFSGIKTSSFNKKTVRKYIYDKLNGFKTPSIKVIIDQNQVEKLCKNNLIIPFILFGNSRGLTLLDEIIKQQNVKLQSLIYGLIISRVFTANPEPIFALRIEKTKFKNSKIPKDDLTLFTPSIVEENQINCIEYSLDASLVLLKNDTTLIDLHYVIPNNSYITHYDFETKKSLLGIGTVFDYLIKKERSNEKRREIGRKNSQINDKLVTNIKWIFNKLD